MSDYYEPRDHETMLLAFTVYDPADHSRSFTIETPTWLDGYREGQQRLDVPRPGVSYNGEWL